MRKVVDGGISGMAVSRHALPWLASIPAQPTELCVMELVSALDMPIGTRLRAPSGSLGQLSLEHSPACHFPGKPLELHLACDDATDQCPLTTTLLSAQTRIAVFVDEVLRTLPVSLRPNDAASGWVARVLALHTEWAGARSITLESVTFAGLPVLCRGLPSTVKVGFNHEPSRRGAVYESVLVGDVHALELALAAGESTEETNAVRPIIG